MPGPYIHIAVSDRVRDMLADWSTWSSGKTTSSVAGFNLGGPTPQEIADLAREHPSYYALGAIGPDLFFFLPDFRSICIGGKRIPLANTLIGIVDWLNELYELLDTWILSDWEKYFGPGNENTAEAISRITGDLSTVVQDITGGFSALSTTALISLASQAHDWIGLFSLGLNKGYDNQDFFWSDMLHYRKTSHFGRSLWTLANEKEQSGQPTVEEAKEIADRLRAYALGYITHLATDTTGHPFVNEKSGGPFRTHWQRHHLVENHMDAHTYDVDSGNNLRYNMFTESALHYRIAFDEDSQVDDYRGGFPDYPLGDSLRQMYVRRRVLDLDSAMPADLAKLIFDAMGQTYQTGATPDPGAAADSSPRIILGGDGRPEPTTPFLPGLSMPGSIPNAYLTLFRYLKISTLDGFKHEKPEPPELFPNLDWPIPTDPHDGPPDGMHHPPIDNDTFLHHILSLIRLFRWLLAVALWFATVIIAIALDLATYGPRLLAYYAIELPLYLMVKAERRIMVMTGFLHPMRDEIDDGLLRLCQGHDDAFLSMLRAMNDTLGGVDDLGMATIVKQIVKYLGILGISAFDATAQALGEADLASSHPSEPRPDANYPHAQPLGPDGKPVEWHAPWIYPTSPNELNPTFAGPYSCGDMPHILLNGQIPGDQSIRSAYEQSSTPADTDQISFSQATPSINLGDPVNFSAYLIWQLTRIDAPANPQTRITDWNLDADRGYAYKCWDWNRHKAPPKGQTNPHLLIDVDGNSYMEPCTPPPQTDKSPPKFGPPCVPLPPKAHDANVPLEIHYTDQSNPGC